jgi:TolB-like protein/tetratricopeptide (TPR) repeat protein
VDLFSELKRRKVYRVGAAYLAVVGAGLQGADLILPALGFGPRVFNGLVLTSLLGFPLAVALAWTFDITRSGIQRTAPVAAGGGDAWTPDPWGRVKAAVVGAGFMGIVWLGVHLWEAPAQTADGGLIPTQAPVVAVLPFADLSPGEDQAYFADGLHEELLHQLSFLPDLRLISRTSVMHFRGSPATIGAIADSLGARYILEGSARRAVDSVRVTVQLIDAETDAHLWSESLSRALSMDELFDLQRTLATRVAGSLGGTLLAAGGERLGRPPTSSLEAYNHYLRGRHHAHRFTRSGMREAADDFERALAMDPDFGLAHAMLAFAYAVQNNLGMGTPGEHFPSIREHIDLALRHAPDDPWTQFAAAAVPYSIEWDWPVAKEFYDRALALDGDFAPARWAMAEWYGMVAGETELALQTVDEALRLDPFASGATAVRASLLHFGRRYAEAAEEYRAMREVDPGNPTNTMNLVSNLALSGQEEEARQLMAEALPRVRATYGPTLAVHLSRLGDLEGARAVRDEWVARREAGGAVAASRLAAAEVAVGNLDEAMTWLERSFADEGGIYTLRDPLWDPLRSDPRFQALWDRVALPGEPVGVGTSG